MMNNFEQYFKEQMMDKELKKEYDDMVPKYEIVRQIIAERTNQNMTQKEFAEKIGMKQSHVSRLESGNYNPTVEFLQKIAKGLGKELHIEFRSPGI